ncbi:MAG: ATP-binding protein [Bilophila wadsworthia]
MLVHTAPILNNEGEVELVLELSVDEQESRRLREELRVTRERFRQLFEESPCYVSVVGRDLQVLEANRAFRHTFGMQSGKRCYELFAGSSAPCDECPVQRSFQDGKPCHTEKWSSTTKAVGQRARLDRAFARHFGQHHRMHEMATDITELRQLQDRLASLGLLMGSTAHGIKGMLTALDGSVYRLGSGIDKGDEARTRDSLKDMRQLVSRLRKMVLDILYFAKERKLDWNILVAEEFMRSVVSTVSDKAAEAGIAMTLEADGDPGTFEADASALSAALVNLLENAVDACRADGSKKEHYVRVSVKGLPDAVEVRIEDNGIGMTEETRTKLFTLFFSSKGKGGTGIGLYVARQVVMQHGGRIEVASVKGEGSTFTVTMPRILAK